MRDFAPSPAVESVHRHDSYGARDGYISPYVLDEENAEYDEARLERCRENACLDCRNLMDWIIW